MFSKQGVPPDTVELILAGCRKSTHSAYGSARNNWHNWCLERDIDSLSNNIVTVLEFLTFLHLSNKSYGTLNIHRSLLSLPPIDGVSIGKHTWVVSLMKGYYNFNPSRPKNAKTRDINVVLNFMSSDENNAKLDWRMLSKKLATLLAISTWMRSSELAVIYRHSIVIPEEGVSFSLLAPRKSQKQGPM